MIVNKKKATASDYCKLRVTSGMGAKKLENAEIALKNSIYIVTLWEEDTLIGMGRIIGDGAISYTVTDIMVDKMYQGRGMGKVIMKHIDEYFENYTDDDAYIMLIANIPANKLYEKFHFKDSTPDSCGMLRKK